MNVSSDNENDSTAECSIQCSRKVGKMKPLVGKKERAVRKFEGWGGATSGNELSNADYSLGVH
jgi:hypothetical protein